ncbi:MAG: oligosaccharide flippase family protein [Bacteroidales bacterium]|nr:oligosaccharide flippase family protein [Bacteroidales bacterium]MCF8387221.1 oligosaccharide flippase family protein [Bacteroidales bacterium]MCF8397869.1 oligosaccharide flippase family protein [Bacteroidales bacterium]
MARTSTNLRNSGWNLANILIYPAAFLAATPFFINRLGESVFGEWMLMNSYVFISVHLVGFGLSHSIIAHVSEAVGKNNRQKLYAYINAATRVLGIMMIVSAFAGLVLLMAPMHETGFFDEYTWNTITVATFVISLKFPELLLQNIYKGFEYYNKASLFNIINRLLSLGFHILLVMKGYSILAIFAANAGVSFIIVLVQAVLIYRSLPSFKLQLVKRFRERKELYHFGFWTWLQTIIAVASYQMDRFLIAYYLGTATVAYYVLASTIANHLHMAFEAVVSWFLPKISRLKAAVRETSQHFHTIRAASVGFSLLLILGVYLISEPLFTLWLGPEKFSKMIHFFELFMIFEAFMIMSIVPKLYLNAIRSLSFITLLELMYKSGIIIGMIILFSIYNTAESLIWGQIIALICFMPLEYYFVNKRIIRGNTFRETILNFLPPLMVMGAILSPGWQVKALFIVFTVLLYWIIYIRDKNFKPKLLAE